MTPEAPRQSVADIQDPVAGGPVDPPAASAELHKATRNPLRRLYNWVLHWAETPYGTPALFLIAVTEMTFFPMPPDVLQIALSMSKPRRSFFYATVSTVGSVLGGVISWYIGMFLWAMVGDFFMKYVPGVTAENLEAVGKAFKNNAFLAIYAAAFTPIPDRVVTIGAGVFHQYVTLDVLILALALGRASRFYLVAGMIYFFADQVKVFLEKYFELTTFAFLVLAVLGFVAIRWLI